MNISFFTRHDRFTTETIESEVALFTDLLSGVRIARVTLFVGQTEGFTIVSEGIR